jgi:hypothetical protein
MIADCTSKQIGVTERNKINTLKEVQLIISNPSIHMYNPQKKKNQLLNEMKLNSVHINIQHNMHKNINNRRCKIKVSPFFWQIY